MVVDLVCKVRQAEVVRQWSIADFDEGEKREAEAFSSRVTFLYPHASSVTSMGGVRRMANTPSHASDRTAWCLQPVTCMEVSSDRPPGHGQDRGLSV